MQLFFRAALFLAIATITWAIISGHQRPWWPLRQGNPERPNIVFILTDDQDVHLNSLDYMPFVKKHLVEQGTYYAKHYCTTALCCPSRVTLWTGKAAHNTNITDVNPPYGGYPKFVESGFNEKYLFPWLQAAGYNTYYTGKLFNVHTVTNYDSPVPAGFTNSDFLLDPFTYNYRNSTFQRKGEAPKSYEGYYSTDVMAEKAYGLLDEAVQSSDPFFLTVAPIAPHADIRMEGSILDPDHVFYFDAPVSAERHKHLFQDEIVPRTENFNPDIPSGASWVFDLPKMNKTVVDWNDHFHRQRLRALQSVDELVDGLFARLKSHGLLENTYVFYSSDNGFHIGQHRLQPGKACGYEEDVNIPLIVRGPGVAKNFTTELVSSHTDLAPTFFDVLGISQRADFDGKAIPLAKQEIEATQASRQRREHVNIEYWGFFGGEGKYGTELHEHNTYKAIRIIGPGYNLYYSIWCTNEHELYDLSVDPGQMHNLLTPTDEYSPDSAQHPIVPPRTLAGHSIEKIVARLDALLLVQKSCSGATCRDPWSELHPNGDVATLEDALDEQFDDFYESQKAVEYSWCWNGYWREADGVMWEDVKKQYLERDGLAWDAWV